MPKTKATFGQVIRDRRRRFDLTQEQVARRIGTSTPYVGHLESGKRHPSDEILSRLADALGLDRKELFFMANPKAKELFQAQNPATTEASAWDEFRRDEDMLHRLNVSTKEMNMLSQVALMGAVRSTRDFIYILNTVRQSLAG
jgi:transcriptional regulator with XRE-family HTH domain